MFVAYFWGLLAGWTWQPGVFVFTQFVDSKRELRSLSSSLHYIAIIALRYITTITITGAVQPLAASYPHDGMYLPLS